MKHYYILVEDHTRGLEVHLLLDEAGIDNRITPTPRAGALKVACGMAILVREEDLDQVKACLRDHPDLYLEIIGIEGQLQPKRDRFM